VITRPTIRRSHAARLAGYSFLILFVELTLIRYIAAYVRVFGFFVNFVLIATFLGMGVGLLRARTRPESGWRRWLPALTLVALFAAVKLGTLVRISVGDQKGEYLWDVLPQGGVGVGLVPAVLVLFALTAALFIPLGAGLGREFRRFKALTAYTLDVAGSLAGVLAFAALSALRTPPLVWFAIALTIWVALSIDVRRGIRSALPMLAGAAGVLALVSWTRAAGERWSPYYRITIGPEKGFPFPCVHVNGMLHQCMVDFRRDRFLYEAYSGPYKTIPLVDTALVIGAGTGNDVAILLSRGAKYIDAVEIDPVIYSIGREQHPLQPYADPRVHVHINDARAFLRTATQKYDVVAMGTLDSQTLLGGMSSVRLDNYVYTVESFRAVHDHLKPGGSLIAYHMSPRPYIGAKVFQLVAVAFQQLPLVDPAFRELFNLTVVGGPGANVRGKSVPRNLVDAVQLPTDNWPYLYLTEPAIPMHYLVALGGVLVIAALLIGLALPGAPRAIRGPHDIALFGTGLGFLLLESKSVTEMSLLFGATWTVNLMVFAAILVCITIANLIVSRMERSALPVLFLALFLALGIAYAIPAAALLSLAPALQWSAGAGLVALPVFFAALIFALLFRDHPEPPRALGVNLMGAIVGGLLEYSAMALGIKALYLIAAVTYLVTLVAVLRWREQYSEHQQNQQGESGRNQPDLAPVVAMRRGEGLHDMA
jgi:SAM-dependent methyltransferase